MFIEPNQRVSVVKAKIKFVVEVETDLNPEWYPGTINDHQRLAIALEGAESDPFLIIDQDSAVWEITGELIPPQKGGDQS